MSDPVMTFSLEAIATYIDRVMEGYTGLAYSVVVALPNGQGGSTFHSITNLQPHAVKDFAREYLASVQNGPTGMIDIPKEPN